MGAQQDSQIENKIRAHNENENRGIKYRSTNLEGELDFPQY